LYQLPLQDIRRFYDFIPVGSSVTQVKELRSRQLMEAMKMLMSVPPPVQQMGGFMINYRKVIEMGLREGLDIKNVQEVIMDAPPPPPPTGTGGGPMSGGGPPLPPDELLRQALVESAPNQQAAEMVMQMPIEQIKGMMGGQGGPPMAPGGNA
jgi:hypothetical protein